MGRLVLANIENVNGDLVPESQSHLAEPLRSWGNSARTTA